MTEATANGDQTTAAGHAAHITQHPRHAYAKALLGEELFQRLATARILVVGAGGIGCELLKNLVLVGFGHVEVIDLDTIDLSNLNRQFLFQKIHIGKPKSIVAAATASQFNPLIDIVPFHANVKETQQFGWEYFATFDVVCNALDNLDARRWVNKMCVMTGVPLVESGTTGFVGQVQPIAPRLSECYDCSEKPTPKTYPVCTIRSTPSTPIHCIVWAKTYLFPQLFGDKADTEDAELDNALKDGENAFEIENLRKEGREMGSLHDAIFSSTSDKQELSRRIFNKVYKTDVERLLSMEEMWRNRTKPVPIDYDASGDEQGEQATNGSEQQATTSTLRDQRVLSLRETIEQFNESLIRLATRISAQPGSTKQSLTFDKDDADAMDFVTATSNLRMRVYHIAPQSRFQTKEMAGNIIPAIASTNAIVAGAQVLQTIHALRRRWKSARFVSLSRTNASRMISDSTLLPPNPACGVCQDDFVRAYIDVEKCSLGQLKDAVKGARDEGGVGYEAEGVEMYEGQRLLADEDFDDNLDRTLASLDVSPGKLITIMDEDGIRCPLHVYISSTSIDGKTTKVVDFGNVDGLPVLRNKPSTSDKKENGDDSEDDDDIVVSDVQQVPKADEGAASKRKRSVDETEDNAQDAQKKTKVAVPAKEERSGAREEDAIELD